MNFFFSLENLLLSRLLLIPIIILFIFIFYLISLNIIIFNRIYNPVEIFFYINKLFSM